MSGRRRSRSELPRAPRELVHPLSIPGAEVAGTEVLHELPPEAAAPALRILRAVLAWSFNPADAALDTAALARLEEQALARPDDPLWSPLAVLAAQLARGPAAERRELALACAAVADWALAEGAERTGLAFAEAAALAWPRNSRFAWLAGRLLRSRGRMKDAERWLRRAHRVSVWTDDWEGQARSMISLGNLFSDRGDLLRAMQVHGKVVVLAQRHGLQQFKAMAFHDLLVITTVLGRCRDAERYAKEALEAYGPAAEQMPTLAHDCAILWLKQAQYHRALPVYRALLPHFHEPADRLRVVANMAHAAAGCGDHELFESGWREAWSLVPLTEGSPALAAALFELACGAALMGNHTYAELAAARAMDAAQDRRESNIIMQSELFLQELRSGRASDERAAPASGGSSADPFVSDLLRELASIPRVVPVGS